MSTNGKKIRFVIKRASDGKQWYLKMESTRNGKIIVHSETYLRISSAQKAAKLIKDHAANAEVVIEE